MAKHRTLWRQRTLDATLDFATRTWRRPLTEQERTRFTHQLDALQATADKDAEGVLRTMLMRVLVSPHSLFRCEPIATTAAEKPLGAWELATRLSLFLWASLPDDDLRRCAADGSLLHDDALRQQTRRMLADPKARGLAEHFFGQWLGFAGFDRGEADPDREFFPAFTPQVRKSMHREAVAFFEDLVRNDRDIRLMVTADYSFLDDTLRNYYQLEPAAASSVTTGRKPVKPVKPTKPNASKPRGSTANDSMPDSEVESQQKEAFERTNVQSVGRGGVLGLGTILVKNSRTRRTSPVNRGLWVVENLLGQHLPPPPANVPPIPDTVEADQGKSLREQMVLHRNNAACAACHTRIDPFGFAFEAFDAAGRRRPAEVLKTIEYETTRDGVLLDGVDALRNYLQKRSDDVNRNLVRRMLGYALSRPVAVSDFPLVEQTVAMLPKHEYRVSSIVEPIVLSRQFRSHRPAKEHELAATKK